MIHRPQDRVLFDEAFRVFWRPPLRGGPWTISAPRRATAVRHTQGERSAGRRGSGIDDPAVATPAESGIDRVDPTSSAPLEVSAPRTSSSSPKRSCARAREMIAALSWDPGMRLTRRWAAGRGKRGRPAPPDSPEHAARRRARVVADARQDDDAPPAGPHLRRERIDGTVCRPHAAPLHA